MAQVPNPVDVHVGKRLRQRRTLLGMSQEKLGELLGLTFQQVQKYERGTNRIGSSRLFRLACILEVPVSYFFEGLQEDGTVAGGPTVMAAAASTEPNHMERRETLELVRAYYRIDDQAVRRRIFDLVKSLGGLRRDAAAEGNGETA
ncbi:MAG: helix-turn-helix domain-containing protein [Alphaproteobacteria bacterium]